MKVYEPSSRRKWNGTPYPDNPLGLPYDNWGRLKKRLKHKD